MSTKLKYIIEDIEDAIGDLDSAVSDAEYAKDKIERLLGRISSSEVIAPLSQAIKEAASLGLPALVAKYGHSSREVKEVEEYIARKK